MNRRHISLSPTLALVALVMFLSPTAIQAQSVKIVTVAFYAGQDRLATLPGLSCSASLASIPDRTIDVTLHLR